MRYAVKMTSPIIFHVSEKAAACSRFSLAPFKLIHLNIESSYLTLHLQPQSRFYTY